MRTIERIELLIRLAYKNANPFEGSAAWEKAKSLMLKRNVTVRDLSSAVQDMWSELSGEPAQGSASSGPVMWDRVCRRCWKRFRTSLSFDAFCSQACRDAWYEARRPHHERRGVRRSHSVRQGSVVREVQDKDWQDQVCTRCGVVYHYMTYPGNPRRYCEQCRVYARREYDKARKSAARALKRAQAGQG